MKSKTTSVTIVGVGITSIMVALKLADEGYAVSVYTKGPDPRLDRNTEQHGATGNGRSARFITGLEGKPHLFDGAINSEALDEIHTHLVDGGWLSRDVSEYSKDDQEWLRRRRKATEDPDHINELYKNYYAKHNRESLAAWLALCEDKPFLFKDADITDPDEGVLVLCSSGELLRTTIKSYEEHMFIKRVLTKEQVSEEFPVYESACEQGHVAGGVIIDGFAFNIHQFIDNAITYLEAQNVTFFWDKEVTNIDLNENGQVLGLQVRDHGLVVSDHYSVNPGAYGNNLLVNTPAKGKIGGVAGRWIVIPRPEGFTLPTKILTDSRLGPSIGDNNLTPFMEDGKPMLAVSGGSVYIGSDHVDLPSLDVCKMIDTENKRIIQLYLAPYYNKLEKSSSIKPWSNTCLRSFTYDDRPVHEVMGTNRGGSLTITAGTNTGTTAIAPYLADWTAQALTRKSSLNG